MYAFKPHVLTARSLYSITKPEGRLDVILCCDGKNLYFNSMSGIDSDFHKIWKYNLAGQQWRLLSSIRHLKNKHDSHDVLIGTAFESKYLVICTLQRYYTRHTPFIHTPARRTCHLYVCDLNSKSSLVRKTGRQVPNHSLRHNFIRHGKYLYTIGIQRDFYKTFLDVYKLNMENDIWEVVYICQGLDANEPVNGSDHTLVYSNNMIYIFGDGNRSTGGRLSSFTKISAFDLEESCWKIIDTYGDENHTPQYPTDRQVFGVTSYTDPDSGDINVIISGGADFKFNINDELIFNDSDYDEFYDVWRLNLTNLKWTCLERFGTVLPSHIEDLSITISPAGKLFIYDENIFEPTEEQKTGIPALHSTWLRIPKLTDICWEAVFHYFPNLKSMTDEEIISLGIPLQSFKSRID
ncbi:kelch domain-containing protein 10 homolog [Microplitis mediator]|uniref:kelch domain-containing protein 10 homolog n=1 Tax=Microplitis mediator TaxID=375433 RepID=UPI0025573E82|nr:kelch domain-containing protein 10 homolog [Microplitis mediator]